MGRFNKIVGDSLTMGTLQLLGLVLVMLQTLFAAKFLGTKGFGTFAIVSVLTMMAAVGTPGFLGAAARELPHYRSSGDAILEGKVRRHVISGEFAVAVAWTLVIAGAASLQSEAIVRHCLYLIAASVFPAKAVAVFQILAYSDKEFRLQASIELARVAVTAGLVMSTVREFGLYAVLAAPLAGHAAAILLYRRRYSVALDWRSLSWAEYRRLSRIGLPITGLNIVSGNNGLQRWGERWLITHYLGPTTLGIFAFFGWITLTVLAMFGSLIQAFQPHVYDLMSRELSAEEVERYLLRPIWVVGVAALILIGGCTAVLPDLIRAFLPEYLPGLPLLGGLLLATLVSCFFWVPGILLYSVRVNGQLYYMLAWTAAVATSLAAAAVLLYAGYGPEAVVAGYVLSQIIVMVTSYWRLRALLFGADGSFRSFVRAFAFPAVNCGLAIWSIQVISVWLMPPLNSKLALMVSALSKGALFLVLVTPSLMRAERKTGIYSNYIRARVPALRKGR